MRCDRNVRMMRYFQSLTQPQASFARLTEKCYLAQILSKTNRRRNVLLLIFNFVHPRITVQTLSCLQQKSTREENCMKRFSIAINFYWRPSLLLNRKKIYKRHESDFQIKLIEQSFEGRKISCAPTGFEKKGCAFQRNTTAWSS